MNKPLVIYYSRTGNTRGVATTIAQELDADREEIREPGRKRGWLRSIIDVLRRSTPEILPLESSLADRPLVLIGSPVWASHVSSPVLTLLRRERGDLSRYALFVTEGGRGGGKAMEEMEREVGHSPLARLEVTDREIETGRYFAKVTKFAQELEDAPVGAPDDRQ